MRGLGAVRVSARLWIRVARRPLRLTVPIARVRVRNLATVDFAPLDAFVVQLQLQPRLRWGWAAFRALVLAQRIGLVTVDAVDVAAG